MKSSDEQMPGLVKEFVAPADQPELMKLAKRQRVSPGQAIVREDVPTNIYFVMSGEVSIRYGNVLDLTRVTNGRVIDLRPLLQGFKAWDSVWKVEKEAEILTIPWQQFYECLQKRPRHLEYLVRTSQSVELQKLSRDLRMFGYARRGLVDLISSLNFGSIADYASENPAASFFCVVTEGSIDVLLETAKKEHRLFSLEPGDHGLVQIETEATKVRCSANAKGWYLDVQDLERLGDEKTFVKFLRHYLGRRDFRSAEEETILRAEPAEDTASREEAPELARGKAPRGFKGLRYRTPEIGEIEKTWASAAALVRIGELSGVDIGLYAAQRSILGARNQSVVESIARVCERLDFRVHRHVLKDALSSSSPMPFLCTLNSAPVFVWSVQDGVVEYELAGTKGLRRVSKNRFRHFMGAEALFWKRHANTRMLPDQHLGFKEYVSVLKHSKIKVTTLILAGTVAFILSLAIPMIYQYFFTSVLTSRRWSTATVLIAAYGGAQILKAILTGIEKAVTIALAQNNQGRLVSTYLRQLAAIPSKIYDFLGHAELFTRFEEAQQVGGALGELVTKPLANIISISACLAIMFMYHAQIGIAALCLIPIVFGISAISGSRRKKLTTVIEHYKAAERRILLEAFDYPETNRSNNTLLMSRWRWEENFFRWSLANLRIGYENAFLSAFNFFSQDGSRFFILGVALRLFMTGQLTQGQVLACFLLTERLSTPLWQAIGFIYELPAVVSHLERFDPVFTVDGESRPGQDFAQRPRESSFEVPAISFENVSFRYGAAAPDVLKDLNFTIRPGEKIGIVGPSGSGKTTLVSLINGLRTPTGGRLRVGDLEVGKCSLDDLRSRIGVVPQRFALFNATIVENITMGRTDISLEDVARVAHLTGADAFISKLPNSYGFMVHRGGGGLSEGQSQLVAVTRALCQKSEIFVLDEASAHLDSLTEERLIRDLLETQKNKTIVFVTQHANLLARMDRILVMQNGRVIEQGSHFDLIGRSESYTELFTRQVSMS